MKRFDKEGHVFLRVWQEQRPYTPLGLVAAALLAYVLVDELVLAHAGLEKFLLHVQDRRLLSAQPLLLGVLNVATSRTQQRVFISNKENFKVTKQAGFYLDAL